MAFEALKTAVSDDDKTKVSKLLKQLDVSRDLGNFFGEKKTTVLHEACKHGQSDIVRLLLNAGADLTQKGYNGWLPLHKAAAWGHPTCVEILLKNKADVNAGTYSQSTPLHLATEKTRVIYHRDILKEGCDLKKINKLYREVVRILLDNGAIVDATNYAGRTPLHSCAVGGHVDMAYLLLERSADVNARDNRSKTPQDVARDNHHYDMVEWFLEMEIQQEKLARQDLARLAASEHNKLEQRLVELVEEHDAEMAEQKAQLQQAYKVDMDAHTEEIRQKLLEEMSQKENVIIQLNSLVKAERQNMDNDHLGYNKYMTYLLATVNGLKEQEKTLKKANEELNVQLEEKSHECASLGMKVEELNGEIDTEKEQSKILVEEHRQEVERVTTGFKQNILLLQQMVDNLNLDLSTQLGLNEEKENTLAALQTDFSEQSKKHTELVEQMKEVQRQAGEQEHIVQTLKQEKEREHELFQTKEGELSTLKKREHEVKAEHLQEIDRVRDEYKQTIQSKDHEVADLKKAMQVLQAEAESLTTQLKSCDSKYEAKIQQLQKTLQEKETEVEVVKADTQKMMTSQDEMHNTKLQEAQSEQKQKISALQQSLTEKEKNLLIVTTQLKSHSEEIKSFEKTQRELQQKHSAELKQTTEKLSQQHQSEMQLYKTERLKAEEAQVTRVRSEMEDRHRTDLKQQEEALLQRYREEKQQLQEGFTQKHSQLQQEMFRVAGAEQAKLKEQYEARIQEVQAKHSADFTAVNKKLEAESQKCQELTSQGDEMRRKVASMDKQMAEERERHKQEDTECKQKAEQYAQQLRLKENELSSTRLLQKQAEHENQRLQSKQEEMSRQSEQRVRKERENAETEIESLKNEIESKQSEIEAKGLELKKQDSVIKGYVKENTKLKENFAARSVDMEARQEELQQKISELQESLSQTTGDLNIMKEKCAAEEGEKQNIQWSYEEELKALEEKWTVKLEDSERLFLEKDNELHELKQQLNSINETSEGSLTKDISTLKEQLSNENLDNSSTEQETASGEGHDACEKEE